MGLVRKTMSVGTLGVVSFRSKKERLRRAERDRRQAEVELDVQQRAREEAERRVGHAERRAHEAEATALEAARYVSKNRRQRRRGRRVRAVLDDLEPTLKARAEQARVKGRVARKRAGKTAAKAQADATQLGRKARKRLDAAKKQAEPIVEQAVEKVQSLR